MAVNIPLTGTGGTTASVATQQIGGVEFQYMKLVGSSNSTAEQSVLTTTPGSADAGMVVRPIGSTGFTQASVLIAGSTANVIGAVAVSSGVVLGAGSSANMLGQISLSTGTGVVLGAGSSANTIGSVSLIAGTTANSIGSAALLAGSTANTIGAVVVSSAGYNMSVTSGTSLFLGLGSSAAYQFVQSIPFSSGNIARTSVSTTVDIQLIAANASRKALIIANRSTSQTVGIGFSTGILTTGLANVDAFIQPASYVAFGIQSGLPLVLGPIRGINLTSTTLAGSVALTEFT